MRLWLVVLSCVCLSSQANSLNVMTEEFPDFQYTNKEGVLVGSAVDKVKAVLQKADIDYVFSVNQWSVTYNAAQRNPNSCIFSIARSDSREQLFDWLFPISTFSTSFYGLRDKKYNINKLDDALNYKTAVIRQNFSHLYLKERGFEEDRHLIMISSFDNVFELLATRKGFIDLVILSDVQFEHKSKTEHMTTMLEKKYTLPNFGAKLYFACNKELAPRTKSKIIEAYKSLYE
ncbi:transporter substrate-binding domain-containing protein [Pseudoalteromonas sp. S16_S37]|uniref:transporter substrate-binding domain-containing protein n=1 Tax=Pseudoalteromonas sp. S16_S37 TaxID=2720228 RepID=UPI001680437C|nr:transporter substrate-binding domain-containing protein [Pseudoalteromonas sp. S16_S37]MBD1583052.1 transporter substrate-binding domain-containing protein [Pseudoalteromonas sp. S16_S37]